MGKTKNVRTCIHTYILKRCHRTTEQQFYLKTKNKTAFALSTFIGEAIVDMSNAGSKERLYLWSIFSPSMKNIIDVVEWRPN